MTADFEAVTPERSRSGPPAPQWAKDAARNADAERALRMSEQRRAPVLPGQLSLELSRSDTYRNIALSALTLAQQLNAELLKVCNDTDHHRSIDTELRSVMQELPK